MELDPDLLAKAAAGAQRIRLRSGAHFSDYDRAQLFHHEALVHSLTALNGRQQAQLPSLALSSPRTTATQEGLATFAEQITGSIDIARMKRISLRIEAIALARDGADFIEVFRYFDAAGQAPAESFSSAQRVFRGVPTTGGAAFTKDTVYLRGLVSVHTFFRQALQREPPAAVPLAVRRQDGAGGRGRVRAAVRVRRAGAAALVADVGGARQRPGRDAGVLAVRQPDSHGSGGVGGAPERKELSLQEVGGIRGDQSRGRPKRRMRLHCSCGCRNPALREETKRSPRHFSGKKMAHSCPSCLQKEEFSTYAGSHIYR